MKNLAFAVILAATPAIADITGDAITADTLVDHAEMVRVADAIDAAVDAKDWATARAQFTDEIAVDLVGGEPATIPADALIAGWSGNLTDEK